MNKFQNLKEEVVAASDAFFPFVDGIEKLVQSGSFCCNTTFWIN